MGSRIGDILEDGAPFIAIFLFILIFFGGLFVIVGISEQGQNELARLCIESGQQWVDGSCIKAGR